MRVNRRGPFYKTTALPAAGRLKRWIGPHSWLSLQLAGWTVVILLPVGDHDGAAAGLSRRFAG